MRFSQKKTTRKGAIGEEIARRHLEKSGFIVYEPVTDGAHPFDKLCATKDKKTLIVAEVKTKPARTFYPDTGIDKRHYETYKAVQELYGLDVYLYFVDEDRSQVYGHRLSVLMKERTVTHKRKQLTYPLEHGGIVYFPLSAMALLGEITEEERQKIVCLSSRNEKYNPGPLL